MILATHGIIQGGQSPYDQILKLANDNGWTLPSASQQILQRALLQSLIDNGIWNKLDTFAVFATDAEDSLGSLSSEFALIDWKRLVQYNDVNSPVFLRNVGFQGNGATNYLETNITGSTVGNTQTLNNSSRFIWIAIAGTVNRNFEGIFQATSNRNGMLNNNSTAHKINQGFSPLSAAFDLTGTGFKGINRTSSTNVQLYNNATASVGITANSTSFAPEIQRVLFGGQGGTTSYFNGAASFYGMGQALVTENTALQNALSTYLTSL